MINYDVYAVYSFHGENTGPQRKFHGFVVKGALFTAELYL